ncbi:helix-turn-helix transcriptional regulator [Bacillus sp. PR5]|nr:helix-turn-helix transcriptional regulator [Bacillus sp. PR5]
MSWRDRLLAAIEEKGLNLRTASLRAGKSPSYLHSLLTRTHKPSLESLIELAEGLEISPLWLIFNLDIDLETEQLILRYQSLDRKRREAVQNVVEAMLPAKDEDQDNYGPELGQ